jgi:hypothetical protein
VLQVVAAPVQVAQLGLQELQILLVLSDMYVPAGQEPTQVVKALLNHGNNELWSQDRQLFALPPVQLKQLVSQSLHILFVISNWYVPTGQETTHVEVAVLNHVIDPLCLHVIQLFAAAPEQVAQSGTTNFICSIRLPCANWTRADALLIRVIEPREAPRMITG